MTKLYVTLEPADGVFCLNREFKKRLVKVMRLKAGDQLHVITPGKQWLCTLAEIHPDHVLLKIIKEIETIPKSKLHLSLAQAIPKGDRFEWLIQKATELGVAEIIPITTERTIVRPGANRIQRWNEIAEQAAGQCENPFPPVIHAPKTLSDFAKTPGDSDFKLLLDEKEGGENLRQLLSNYNGNRITFVVGPEGGWSEKERQLLQSAQFQPIHLGPRILRAETAGLVLATLLQYELGDFVSAGHVETDSTTS